MTRGSLQSTNKFRLDDITESQVKLKVKYLFNVRYMRLTVKVKFVIGYHYDHHAKFSSRSVMYTCKCGTLLLVSRGYWCVALVLLLNWSCYSSLGWITRSASPLSLELLSLLSVRVEIGFAGARKTPVWVILWLKEDIYWFWNLSIQLERERADHQNDLRQDWSVMAQACNWTILGTVGKFLQCLSYLSCLVTDIKSSVCLCICRPNQCGRPCSAPNEGCRSVRGSHTF